MSEIQPYQPAESLVVSTGQTDWTPEQVVALRHIGVEHASEGDLRVFFHHCQRAGLDPFLRQIYMIGRESSEKQPDGSWKKVVKQTIQTGIDGYRLIARRAATRSGDSLSIGAPEWAHDDGTWRPVWSQAWGMPVAARVTVCRDGEDFPAIALFDEYKQTTRDGNLTRMWAQRPAGQIAKCAEVLALRKAFPNDLSGIYTDDVMSHEDGHQAIEQKPQAGLAGILAAKAAAAPAEPLLGVPSDLSQKLFSLFDQVGLVGKEMTLGYIAQTIGREIASSRELTVSEAEQIVAALEHELEPVADVTTGEVIDGGDQS